MLNDNNVPDLKDEELEQNPLTDPEIQEDQTFELDKDGVLKPIEAVESRTAPSAPSGWLQGLIDKGGDGDV